MLDNDPLWYKDAVIYEVHVRAFHDSVGDGVGDFRGLTQKLDYLADLGITAIWILPFYPSPLKDDGYDIADYTDVHPQYGRLADFKEFLDEAHRRGLRVITELVINHTSDQHPWFQRARHAPPGSVERNFYVWSDTPDRYSQARIIFKDFEASNWSWDPVARAYYWHRFYHHQPDLNYDNPAVWEAIFPVLDQWMAMGVDGLRLDAIPYLYEREGTNCENLPETHVFLKALRKHADEKFAGRMFLAEANQWPEDAVPYFGNGDECHMAFHFPVMPRLFMALYQEDRFPILDILAQTPTIPPNCQWCVFLRNHDELTLEMVTDEERDYMYRAYAEDRSARINLGIRRRLAPLLRNDRRRIELLNALLFSLPGTPVIYYGDEIGMGDNIYLGDRNGVRTPMQWSADRNAGFSRTNPQKLYLPIIIDPEYHYETVNVEAQQANPSSLLWWTKRLISLRKRYKAFGRGSIEFLEPTNSKVLVFVRQYQDERLLIVANLSRFVQHVELELHKYTNQIPEELFGRSRFPRITDRPYSLTLGPHGFYWFELVEETETQTTLGTHHDLPRISRPENLQELFSNSNQTEIETLLPAYLQRRRPGGAPVLITAARILNVIPFSRDTHQAWVLLLKVEFQVGIPEQMLLSFTVVSSEVIPELLEPIAMCGFAKLGGDTEAYLVDALAFPPFALGILDLMVKGKPLSVGDTELVVVNSPELIELADTDPRELTPRLQRSERNTFSIHFGSRIVYKTFRRLEEGPHPDLEIGRYLNEKSSWNGAAQVIGHIELRRRSRRTEPIILSVARRYVPNQGNAWQYTLDQLSNYFELVSTVPPGEMTGETVAELIGGYASLIRGLGQRTAEFHTILGENRDNPVFAPEPMGRLYLRSLYQSMRTLTGQLCSRIKRNSERIPESDRELALRLVEQQPKLLRRFRVILDQGVTGQRIRINGDYHLGQLLYTGNNFVLIDCEGDLTRPLGERRLKRSPLRDVACLLRSFDYAVGCVLQGLATGKGRPPGMIRLEDRARLSPWGAAWYDHVSRTFSQAYFETMHSSDLLPNTDAGQNTLLDVLLLEKALQEVDHELTFRPDWIVVPIRGVLRLLDNWAEPTPPLRS